MNTIRMTLALVVALSACGIDKPIDVADSMPLRKQPVTVLLQGLNQKAPGTVGVLGQLEVAENTRIQKGTAAGIELVRRNGLVEVADTTLTSASRMVSYGGGILVSSNGGFDRFDPTAKTFASIGYPHTPFGVSRADYQTPSTSSSGAQTPTQSGLDLAYIGDRGCAVWFDQAGAVQYVIRNSAGIALASGAIVSSGATKTKVVALGTSWYVFWKEANAIRGASISASSLTAGAATTVIAAGSALAGTDYDVQTGFDSTHIALLYRSAAGTYVRCLLSTAFAVGTTVSDSTAANQPDVALCWLSQASFGASLFYATLNSGDILKIQTINATTLASTATITQATTLAASSKNMVGGSTVSLSSAVPFVLVDQTFTDGAGVTHRSISYGASGTFGAINNAAGLISRVFYANSTAHFASIYNSSQASGAVAAPQSAVFVQSVDANAHAQSAKMLPGEAGQLTTFEVTSMTADSSGAFRGLFARRVSADTVTGEVVIQYGLSELALAVNPTTIGAPLAFAGVALFPGGELFEIDSGPARLPDFNPSHEQGIRFYPEIPVLTEGAAASGSIVPGTRSYVMRWKWIDAAGQVYRTAMSTPVPITTVNANSSVAVKFYGPASQSARTYLQVEVYRTPKDGTGDIYYRVTPAVFTVTVTGSGVITTFTDTASEATLAAGEPWSPDEELENIPPPALNDICEHKGHIVGVDAERPWRLRISKEYTAGTGLGFTDSFFVDTPDSTGPVYKVMSMDGHLIAFKRDVIYVYAGDFPDNTGAGTFPSPSLLPVAVGTEQPRSVVLTDLGIVFYSSKRGFWLLNRSLGVKYIGSAVETTAANQTVSGATVHPTYPEIRFTTEGGTTFVLNTWATEVAGAPIWTTFTGQPCIHSIVHQGDWYLLTAAGKLLKEDLTRWQDGVALGGGAFTAGTAFTRRVKVSDVNFAGVNGFARVYSGSLTGEWYASEKVKITITNNHRLTDPETGLPASERPFTYDATVNPDPYVLDFFPAVQKVTAMDLQIEDTADYQTQGSAWSALSFQVGVKGGSFRQGTSHSMAGGARKP